MTNRKKSQAQALPVNRSKLPRSLHLVPRGMVSAAGQSVSGMRSDFLRYVDLHPALFLLTGVAIIALIGVIYLTQVTAVTNANYTLQSLQAEQRKLIQQQQDLRLEIARAQSLPNIEKQAREKLHMVPIEDKYEYIQIPPGPLAGIRATPTAQP